MKQSIARVLRNSTANGRTISAVEYVGNGFEESKLLIQYITPPLDLPLPNISTVPFMDFPRYLQVIGSALPGGAETADIISQNIVLPAIPDRIVIYAKKNGLTTTEGDYYLPVKKISLNWDNFAGLLSAQSTTQLYQISVHNGLDMDYSAWSGHAVTGSIGVSGVTDPIPYQTKGKVAGFKVASVGGFLVLSPGVDYGLQAGQASGLIGNYSMQYTCTLFNPGDDIPANGATLFTLCVFSGFFQTLAGSSRVIRGPLSEADILSAPLAPEQTVDHLSRMVGHGFMDKMGSFLSKAKSVYAASKPIVSAIKEALPEDGRVGMVKGALGKVGYGMAGAGPAGGRKSLSARLM